MPNDLENLQIRVRALVSSIYERRHAPIPGAILMPALAAELRAEHPDFEIKSHLRSLGYKTFGAFIEQVPDITYQRRPGSDFLVSPAGTSDLAKAFAQPAKLIRRDFWRAFIEFPNPETVRIYDANGDTILNEPVNTSVSGPIIEPVLQATQLEWRKKFAGEQPESSRSRIEVLLSRGGREAFNEFARFMRDNPEIGRSWNRYQQNLLSESIASWAEKNHISLRVWEAVTGSAAESVPITKRSELYNLLDRIPIEKVMELKVPLEWLLSIARER